MKDYLLKFPPVYRLWSTLVRGGRSRKRFVDMLHIQPGSRLLDIGCGPAEILSSLPEVEYVGFDANPKYIHAAQKKHGKKGKFYCQTVDEENLSTHSSFDVVLAIGILHHLDDSEAKKLFHIAFQALKPQGRLITLDGVYEKGQSAIARYLISKDRGKHVRDKAGYMNIASQVFFEIDATIKTDLLFIPYTHLLMECKR